MPYTQAIIASGGTAQFTYAVSTGTLPAGLALDAASGAISGTPTQGGMFNITITATDSSTGAGGTYSNGQAYALTVAAPGMILAPFTLPDAQYGTTYSQTLVAEGGTAPYIFTIGAGALPDGLALDAGVISGSPTAPGNFDFTVNATDSSTGVGAPYSTSLSYTVAVDAADTDFVFSPNGVLWPMRWPGRPIANPSARLEEQTRYCIGFQPAIYPREWCLTSQREN